MRAAVVGFDEGDGRGEGVVAGGAGDGFGARFGGGRAGGEAEVADGGVERHGRGGGVVHW